MRPTKRHANEIAPLTLNFNWRATLDPLRFNHIKTLSAATVQSSTLSRTSTWHCFSTKRSVLNNADNGSSQEPSANSINNCIRDFLTIVSSGVKTVPHRFPFVLKPPGNGIETPRSSGDRHRSSHTCRGTVPFNAPFVAPLVAFLLCSGE